VDVMATLGYESYLVDFDPAIFMDSQAWLGTNVQLHSPPPSARLFDSGRVPCASCRTSRAVSHVMTRVYFHLQVADLLEYADRTEF